MRLPSNLRMNAKDIINPRGQGQTPGKKAAELAANHHEWNALPPIAQ
jgi:hypothetical protein